MTRRNKSKKAKVGNTLLHGAGASSWQDRGSLQQGVIISKNPYYNNDYYRRWQDWVRWYYTDWAARKVVDIPVNDAFRVEPELKGLPDDVRKTLIKYERLFGGRDKLKQAATQERLLGGSAIFIGLKDEDEDNTTKPIDLSCIEKGDLAFLNVISTEKISQVEYDQDPFSPMYSTPKYYTINGRNVEVSRLLVFDGNPLFNIVSMNILQNFRFNPAGFGESVLTPLFDSLVRFAGTQEGAYHLVNMASVLLVKCNKLLELQASGAGDRALDALNKMAEQISIYRAGVLQGKDVDVAQHSATFGSVPELLQTFAQILAAGSDIPATRFLGQAPGGLNATGESDLENYYNNIASWQNTRLKPLEMRLYNILGASCFGYEEWRQYEKDFDIEYKPLWNLKETEQAQVDLQRAQMISTLEQSGYINRENAIEELKARKLFINDISAEDMPDMASLDYMTGENPEQTPTADDNNKLFKDIAKIENSFIENDKWITVKPNGEDAKGRHLFLDGEETPKEAMKRAWGVDLDKKKKAPESDDKPVETEKKQDDGYDWQPLKSKDIKKIKARDPEHYKQIMETQKKQEADDPKFEKGGFELERATPKAYLLREGDKTFWVQKKWLREDGSLTPAGEKARSEAKTDTEKKQEYEEKQRKRAEGVRMPEKADWESDRALGYDLTLDFYDTERSKRHRIFIPKSVIQENGNIPTWIIEKKIEEISDAYPFNKFGGFYIEDHPFKGYSLGEKDISGLDPKLYEKTGNTQKIYNATESVIYTVENSRVYKSIDNGNTWQEIGEEEE